MSERNLSLEDRVNLSRLLMSVLQKWEVDAGQQRSLLGMPDSAKGSDLRKLQGGKPFPEDEHMLSRAEHLLAIDDCLRTAYPRSSHMASYWLHQASRHFGQRTPLRVMLEGGMDGLRRVRGHLDCTQGWI